MSRSASLVFKNAVLTSPSATFHPFTEATDCQIRNPVGGQLVQSLDKEYFKLFSLPRGATLVFSTVSFSSFFKIT